MSGDDEIPNGTEPLDVSTEEARASESQAAARSIKIEDLAKIVANMNLFLSRLSQISCFKDAQLSLPEWLVLSYLSSRPGANSKLLSRLLGLAVQRVDGLLASLQTAALVSPTNRKGWELTDTAKSRLNLLDRTLQPKLAEIFKGRERALWGLGRTLKTLLLLGDNQTEPQTEAGSKAT